MQALGVERPRQFHRVGGAADVDRRVALRRGGHVVDGGEMEEVVDLAAQLGHLLGLDPQQRPAQVADDRLDALRGGRAGDDAPALDQVVQARPAALPHEDVHLALAFRRAAARRDGVR